MNVASKEPPPYPNVLVGSSPLDGLSLLETMRQFGLNLTNQPNQHLPVPLFVIQPVLEVKIWPLES